MKKIIFLVVLAFVTLTTTQAQDYMVIDTTINKTQKYKAVKEGIDGIESSLVKLFTREKITKDTMTHLVESRELVDYLREGVNTYGELFYQIDTVYYQKITTERYTITTGQTLTFDYFQDGDDSRSIGIIHEWDVLNIRVEELRADPEINKIEDEPEFKNIIETQAKLNRIYDKIKKQ